MSKHVLDKSDIAANAIQLEPNEICEIEFQNRPLAIEIDSNGEARVYLTTNGSDPEVGGSKSRELPDECHPVRVINIPPAPNDEPLVVKLISSGEPIVSVASQGRK